MLCQPSRLFPVAGTEQFDHRARRIHAARRVDSRPDAKAKIVGVHLRAIATTGDINQRPQTWIHGARQIRKTQRHDRAILADEFGHIGDRPDCHHFQKAGND